MSKNYRNRGEIQIASNAGRLRLQFPAAYFADKKQKFVALGLEDTPINRIEAEIAISRIKLDIFNQSFDPSLNKYRQVAEITAINPTVVFELWTKYLEYREVSLKASTFDYLQKGLGWYIEQCPYQSFKEALLIREWLLNFTSVGMTKRVLLYLNAATEWGIQHEILALKKSPFAGMQKDLPKHQYEENATPNAFSLQETANILNTFEHNINDHYRHYTNFVKFLLMTGCRPSEAIGLRCGEVSLDRDFVLFSGSIVRIQGQPIRMEGSKNNKRRKFPLNPVLKQIIRDVMPPDATADRLIFQSLNGRVIQYSYFSQKIWNCVVEPVLKRPSTPYNCRDSFITNQIAGGISPSIVCAWCDTSLVVVQKRYLDPRHATSVIPI
jgi:integrase